MAYLFYPPVTFTCMSDSKEVAVWGLKSINYRDLDDGFEDRTINCPENKEEFKWNEKMIPCE